MRLYGLNAFEFEVLEECEASELNEREIAWIAYYGCYMKGYNRTTGGEQGHKCEGEKHHNHKLTEDEVYEIRERYNKHEYGYLVYEDYKDKINPTGFRKVWNGYTWQKVHMDVYTEENKTFHKWVRNAHPGRSTGTGKQLTQQEIIKIRSRLAKGETQDEIWEDYKDRFKFKQTFKNICSNKTYKNIVANS